MPAIGSLPTSGNAYYIPGSRFNPSGAGGTGFNATSYPTGELGSWLAQNFGNLWGEMTPSDMYQTQQLGLQNDLQRFGISAPLSSAQRMQTERLQAESEQNALNRAAQQAQLQMQLGNTLANTVAGQGWQDQANVDRSNAQFSDTLRNLAAEIAAQQGIRERGIYSPQEMERLRATAGQQINMRAAETARQALSQRLGGGNMSPFAAAAIQSQGSADAGRAMAEMSAGLTQQQHASQQQAAQLLSSFIGQQGQIAGQQSANQMRVMPGYAQNIMNNAPQGGGGSALNITTGSLGTTTPRLPRAYQWGQAGWR
jgi:hypothetical protein